MPMKNVVALIAAVLLLLCPPALQAQQKKKPQSYGIDISHHQGDIKWEKVPRNIKFVYIKATEGATVQDDKYRRNVDGAHSRNLKVGAYHYFRMKSSAHAQFNNFKSVVSKSDLDLIPMVDVETTDGRSSKALRDSLQVFIRLVKNHYGKAPMIYSMQGFYNEHLGEKFNRYHLYIGRYGQNGHEGTRPPVINGKGTYTIWQYSERGKVPGISKSVDLARFNSHHSISSISLR